MERKYQAFVSSTYEDLKIERQAVIGTLLDNGFIPVGMEQFPASPLSQWEYITEMIKSSDYYILIVAGRYGSVDPETGISYTEKEYHYAVSQKIPILVFLHSDISRIEVGKSAKTDKEKESLGGFREALKNSQRLIKYYDNADDLKAKVITATHDAVRSFPRPGWVRADAAGVKNTGDSSSEIAELRKSISEIRSAQTWRDFNTRPHSKNLGDFDPISNEASVLLAYAAKGSDGRIMVSKSLTGTAISAGKWNFTGEGGAREVARWSEVIDELDDAGYIKPEGWKKDMYSVTRKGYTLSDKIIDECEIDVEKSPATYLFDP